MKISLLLPLITSLAFSQVTQIPGPSGGGGGGSPGGSNNQIQYRVDGSTFGGTSDYRALAGTQGTPGAANPYVTEEDVRVSAGYVDVVRTSDTVLTWFGKCTTAAPCTISTPGGFTDVADTSLTVTASGSVEGAVYLAWGKDEDTYVVFADLSAGSLSDLAAEFDGDSLDILDIADYDSTLYAISFGSWATSAAATWAATPQSASPKYPSIIYTSSGGASSVSGLTDCKLTRTDTVTLTMTTPCNLKLGSTVYPLVSDIVTVLTSGTGTAFIYGYTGGTVYVASDVTIASCTNCTAIVGSSFPSGSIPLYQWTATSDEWDSTGTDLRFVFSNIQITAGPGITVTPTTDGYQISSGSEYWSIPLAAIDDGNVAKPSSNVYLGSGHNVSAGYWTYGSNENAITVPSIYMSDAGVAYFRVSHRIPWDLTSLSVKFGITENEGASGDIYITVNTFCTKFDDSTAGDTISYNNGTPQTVTMPAWKKSKMLTFTDAAYDNGCTADSMLHVVVYRDPDNGGDTYAHPVPVSDLILTLGH